MSKKNPFDTYNNSFNRGLNNPLQVFTAARTHSEERQQRIEEQSSQMPAAVSLPPHLFIPESGQSIDPRVLVEVTPGTTEVFRFIAPQGAKTRFLGYALFSDALDFTLLEFIPRINGNRVLPYHGAPQTQADGSQTFKIGLGLTADFSTLVPVALDMNPSEILTWDVINNDVVNVAVGVRMSGYVDFTIQRTTTRYGG